MNTPIFGTFQKAVRIRPNTTGSARRWLQRMGGLVLFFFVLFLVLGRVVGVPRAWKDRLVRELASRGLEVDAKKITLDPLGGLVARDLVVYRDAGRKEERLRVGRVELALNWLAWKKGEPFLSGARLRDAHIDWPLGEGVEAVARRVEAVIEFRPGEIRFQRLRGQVLGFDLDLQGRVGTEQGRMAAPQILPMAAAWRSLEKALKDLGGPAPRIQSEFSVEIGRPDLNKAEILMTGNRAVWKGVHLKELELRATLADGAARLEKFHIGFERGAFEMVGWADFAGGRAAVEYSSDADLSLFAPAAGGMELTLRELHGQNPPQITGKIEMDWIQTPGFLWQSRLEMGEFRLGLVPYRSLVVPWVSDGKRWMLQGLKLEAVSGGTLEGQLTFDGKAELKGNFQSHLDPKGLAPLFGPGATAFWNSLDFVAAPKIDMRVTGAGLSEELIRLDGKVDAGPFRYKGVEISDLTGDYSFAKGELKVGHLQVHSGGGAGTGELTYILTPNAVSFQGVQSTLPVREFSPVFGEKFRKTMEPYEFVDRPFVTLNGKVDLESKGLSQLKATAKTKEGLHYKVAGKLILFQNVDVQVEVAGRKVTVKTAPHAPAHAVGGKVKVEVMVNGETKVQSTKIELLDVDFDPLVQTYFGNSGYTGKLDGTIMLDGASQNWKKWTGRGKLEVRDGSFPGLGAFEKAMNAPAEWVGLTDQNAEMDFELGEGKLLVSRLDIESALVITTGHGTYDMVNDQLENFLMRQNLRGPAGVPFFLVSQMFQYEGNGSLKNPVWKPRNFDDDKK